jgi:hypothetical protein
MLPTYLEVQTIMVQLGRVVHPDKQDYSYEYNLSDRKSILKMSTQYKKTKPYLKATWWFIG